MENKTSKASNPHWPMLLAMQVEIGRENTETRGDYGASVHSKNSFRWVQFINGVIGEHLFIFFSMLGLLTLMTIVTQKLFAELWWKIVSQFLI